MCKDLRWNIELLKELLQDPTIESEGDLYWPWREQTCRSHPRYYVLPKIVIRELETDRGRLYGGASANCLNQGTS